ncbi:MAG: hypothetical protein AB7D57_06880 [Desulfovibrionaceae bacterium]
MTPDRPAAPGPLGPDPAAPADAAPLEAARDLTRRLDRLAARAETWTELHAETRARLTQARDFLDLAPLAEHAIEDLSTALFGEVLDEIEANLTFAVQEILGQRRTVVTQREVRAGRLQVAFLIHNPPEAAPADADTPNDAPEADAKPPKAPDPCAEDILTGQGGSVANILSVGLRLIALSQLDPARHRPFLVLDEQDCWLKPELVAPFMKLVRAIARRLGLQVLVISHHPLDRFISAADQILSLTPSREHGAKLERLR